MRFGTRSRDDEGRTPSTQPGQPAQFTTPPSPTPIMERAVAPSKRLQRIAEHFQQQSDLLASMREQFEAEMEPLHELLVRQSAAMQRVMANLEERLRPVAEYANSEEANLEALAQRIAAGGADHVARSFAPYLEEQRARINATRAQIEGQRAPFERYGEQAREAVEVALSRFDAEVQALEQNLSEQRRVMMRMLDAMRSEAFAAAKAYLDSRQQALSGIATNGTTDPSEIGKTMHALRSEIEVLAGQSDHIRQLVDQTETSDRDLSASAVSGIRPMAASGWAERSDPASAPAAPGGEQQTDAG